MGLSDFLLEVARFLVVGVLVGTVVVVGLRANFKEKTQIGLCCPSPQHSTIETLDTYAVKLVEVYRMYGE